MAKVTPADGISEQQWLQISEKRRIKTDDKIYFEMFSDIELREQIKDTGA